MTCLNIWFHFHFQDERNFRALKENLLEQLDRKHQSDYWQRSQQQYSAPQPKKATVSTKPATVSHASAANDRGASHPINDVDQDWLSGTNFKVTEKAKKEKKEKKKKKGMTNL
jgi:hypothetical protein